MYHKKRNRMKVLEIVLFACWLLVVIVVYAGLVGFGAYATALLCL